MQDSKQQVRLVSVVWYKVFPPVFGGQKGVAEFLLALSKHLNIYLVCSENNKLTEPGFTWEASLPIRKRQVLEPGTFRIIRAALEAQRATHLLIEHPYYGLWAVWLAARFRIPLVVHAHNLEYARFRQMGTWWWPVLFVLERFTLRNARLSLFKTNEDRQQAIRRFKLDPAKTLVVPFGLQRAAPPAETEQQRARRELQETYGIPREHAILYFCGTLDYAPNAWAVKTLVEELLPRLSASGRSYTLLVTGRNEFPAFAWVNALRHDALILAGEVPDVAPFFMGADLFLNPVTKGGGVKVKVLEALSYGLPVVSYASGAVGIDPAVCGEQLTVVPDGKAAELVRSVEQVVQKGKGSVPDVFFETYSWERITGRLAEILCRLSD
jgi:polysaccharide biosynthesis protein PslH